MNDFSDFNCEKVFLVFGLTSEGLSCLGSFTDAIEAYTFAADTSGGIVTPGTSVSEFQHKERMDIKCSKGNKLCQ